MAGLGALVADAAGTTACDITSEPPGPRLVEAIVALVVPAVACSCGGDVAGRMTGFNGLTQGVALCGGRWPSRWSWP